jgi:L-ascorbate metabolism protein UlaG (beta-lactamase superfamily)
MIARMCRWVFVVIIFLLATALPAAAQRGISKEASRPLLSAKPDEPEPNSKRATAVKESTPVVPEVKEPTTSIRWGGHAFVYITSSTGVRVAIDPFGMERVKYLFPVRLPADVILISSESEDHSAAERLFGAPQVFRSVTAVGVNRANGSLFKGVQVFRDSRRGTGANYSTAFIFSFDGLTFAHMGVIGDALDAKQREDIGNVDVLFLPVGNLNISVADLNRIAADLHAKIIVPISYKTEATGSMELRTVDEFLANQTNDVKRVDAIEFPVNRLLLPDKPTIYVLNTP